MSTLLLMFSVFLGYILMYRLYGRFLGRKIFKLDKLANVPSREMEDGIDYVPTKKEVIFGHHFASIAGTGPIVGPAIAVIWGWVPAILWIFLGSIFIGAVHDFGVLIASLRNKGYSIAQITGKYINRRIMIFFYIIGILELWIFISILGMVMAIIFDLFPGSVLPVWLEIPIAVLLGYLVYKKGKSILVWSIIAVIAMYITVLIGNFVPVSINEFMGLSPAAIWTILLLIYAYIASVLPVTTLLQPRDFINSHQLIIAMGLLILGIIVSAFTTDLDFVAPAINTNVSGAPPMLPFLFIIIACGAVSGFHAIVSSGTSSKQVRNEKDALFVGYGSMLMEGGLASLVIIAAAAGIGLGYVDQQGITLMGIDAWEGHYSSWEAARGLGSKITAFVVGSANLINSLGIPKEYAIIIMGVFVASFAGTSLDTGTRLQRYFFTELFSGINIFKNRYFSTAIVILTAMLLVFNSGADGKGALKLWPLFGTINQTLAALALIVISNYLRRKSGKGYLITLLPALFVAAMTLWAAVYNQISYWESNKHLLLSINLILIFLTLAILTEGLIKLFKTPDRG